MTLGFRQSLSLEDKEIYIRSGMIHILAISGLHVGMVYSLIHLGLTVLDTSFTNRHFVAPCIALIYVIATGAAPSAMRAWLMLTLWAVGRGLKLLVMPINTILVAASMLLMLNPFFVFQSGFQFSFVVVLSLITGWDSDQKRLCRVRRTWYPD